MPVGCGGCLVGDGFFYNDAELVSVLDGKTAEGDLWCEVGFAVGGQPCIGGNVPRKFGVDHVRGDDILVGAFRELVYIIG